MRTLLLFLLVAAPAFADPTYRPAYDQADAIQAKMELQASNAAGFSMCMTCPAVHQAHKAALLAQAITQCQKDYSAQPEMLSKCTAFWQTYLQ